MTVLIGVRTLVLARAFLLEWKIKEQVRSPQFRGIRPFAHTLKRRIVLRPLLLLLPTILMTLVPAAVSGVRKVRLWSDVGNPVIPRQLGRRPIKGRTVLTRTLKMQIGLVMLQPLMVPGRSLLKL